MYVASRSQDIVRNTIKHLQINNSKKLKNHDVVSNLEYLEVLSLNSCGKISSLTFLNKMFNLQSFYFVDTDVLDGDLSPLLNLGNVGFLNKRHFSHTYLEVKEIITKLKANKANSADAKKPLG